MAQGYYHRDYAASLSDFGSVKLLQNANAWMLTRNIAGTNQNDAMGCYPLLCCENWPGLFEDFIHVEQDLISFSCITDPFGKYSFSTLESVFDVTINFKKHFIVDLDLPLQQRISKHHTREILRAKKHVQVELYVNLTEILDEWCELYKQLIQRHNIHGISAFSRSSFEKLLKVPGLVAYRATLDKETVGISLWFISGDICYHHLAAYSDNGYKSGASYSLMEYALNHFSDIGIRWANLGAGAGLIQSATDGLSRFKGGWSTDTRTSFLCGKILNPATYNLLTNVARKKHSSYFPAYREGEF